MRGITAAAILAAVALGLAAPSFAINCEQARKYAATGRSPEDIADTMVVDVDEVKKCLASGGSAASGGSGSSGAPASAGSTDSGSGTAGSAGGASGSGSGHPGH